MHAHHDVLIGNLLGEHGLCSRVTVSFTPLHKTLHAKPS